MQCNRLPGFRMAGLPLTDPVLCQGAPAGRDPMQLDQLKRREFITLLGGAAAWPLAARAQQDERMRRIGLLTGGPRPDDQDAQANIAVFLEGLQRLGWIDGRNVRIDYRWAL